MDWLKPANLAGRFLLELCMLAALAYWGFHEYGGATQFVLGIGAPLLAAAYIVNRILIVVWLQ